MEGCDVVLVAVLLAVVFVTVDASVSNRVDEGKEVGCVEGCDGGVTAVVLLLVLLFDNWEGWNDCVGCVGCIKGRDDGWVFVNRMEGRVEGWWDCADGRQEGCPDGYRPHPAGASPCPCAAG